MSGESSPTHPISKRMSSPRFQVRSMAAIAEKDAPLQTDPVPTKPAQDEPVTDELNADVETLNAETLACVERITVKDIGVSVALRETQESA